MQATPKKRVFFGPGGGGCPPAGSRSGAASGSPAALQSRPLARVRSSTSRSTDAARSASSCSRWASARSGRTSSVWSVTWPNGSWCGIASPRITPVCSSYPVGDRERFDVPGQLVGRAEDAVIEDATIAQPGQVRVPAVVAPQLADPDMAMLPDAGQPVVQVVTDAAGALHGAQQVSLAELVAGPFRQALLRTVGADDIPGDRAVGLRLDRHERPVVCGGDAQRHRLVGACQPVRGLRGLLGGQVQFPDPLLCAGDAVQAR